MHPKLKDRLLVPVTTEAFIVTLIMNCYEQQCFLFSKYHEYGWLTPIATMKQMDKIKKQQEATAAKEKDKLKKQAAAANATTAQEVTLEMLEEKRDEALAEVAEEVRKKKEKIPADKGEDGEEDDEEDGEQDGKQDGEEDGEQGGGKDDENGANGKKAGGGGEDNAAAPEGTDAKDPCDHHKLACKDAGQARYGSMSEEGMGYFNIMVRRIAAARKRKASRNFPNAKGVELAFVKKHKELHNLTANRPEDERKGSTAARTAGAGRVEKVPADWLANMDL